MENPVRVLIVDDEEDFLHTMEYWLKSKGYNVLCAINGYEAIGIVRNNLVDIIFLDINMPAMDGIATLKTIRRMNKALPVIMITAYVTEEKMEQTKEYGISGFFCKNDNFEDSISMIETVIRAHRGLKK